MTKMSTLACQIQVTTSGVPLFKGSPVLDQTKMDVKELSVQKCQLYMSRQGGASVNEHSAVIRF